MGMAVARLAAAPAGGRPLAYVAGGALLFAAVALDTVLGSHILLAQRVPLFGLASALMILGLVRAEAGGRVIGGHRWLQLLGDASYALYLIHFPMISILCKLAVALHMNQLGVMGALVSYLLILAGCLGGAVAFHLWIERPVTAYVRTRLTAARPVPA
jgi:peptidoglycan/LPS O-acetylase OafA/YrhL